MRKIDRKLRPHRRVTQNVSSQMELLPNLKINSDSGTSDQINSVQMNSDQDSVHQNWIEIFPYAISMGPMHSRPILIFRDEKERVHLPIWLSPLDAGIAALDLSKNTNFHSLSIKILEEAGIRVESCYFVGLQGHHQFVRLELKGHPKLKELKVRADEAIPFCSAQKAKFFTTPEFIMQCRDVDLELMGLEQSLHLQPEIGSKKHAYMM